MAITFIIADSHQSAYLKPLHLVLSTLRVPIQAIVDSPIKFTRYIVTSLSTNQTLIEENTHLRAQNLILAAQLQKFMDLQNENKDLRALLSSSPQSAERLLVAQVLDVQAEPYLSQIVIDKGSDDGVYQNQAVIDAQGIVGQVVTVNPSTSTVMLVTDSLNAVPVQVARNGMRAIAVGNGALGTLSLVHVPLTADIKEGDMLVSSGLGQRYPTGYPVGKIEHINRETANSFAMITVEPFAKLQHNRLVLLVWPQQPAPVKTKSSTKHHAHK